MKKILSIVTSLVIGASAYTIDIQPGWQLKGALADINVTSFNNMNIASVWAYDSVNNKWKAYLPNLPISLAAYDIEDLKQIKQGEGFWVNAIGFTNIEINNNSYESGYSDGGYYDNNLSAYLIDKPVDFNLSDVAGKTFKLFNYDNGNFDDLTFDSNGTATLEKEGVTDTFKFENGVIDFYEDNTMRAKSQKIVSDNNGIINLVTVYDYDGNNTLESSYQYLSSLLTTVNPVDMSTLTYPKTYYDAFGDTITFNEDGTITYPWGNDESNYTIEDGKIVTFDQEGDENNGESVKDDYQIVGTIGRYYVMKEHELYTNWHLEETLKGKTINDIIDTNDSVDGYYLKSDGTIVSDNEYEDVNLSYEKISDTEIKIQKCDSYGECWSDRTVVIDPDTGKVSEIYDSYWTEVLSESPIVNDTDTVNYKKSSKSVDFKFKREEIQKRLF